MKSHKIQVTFDYFAPYPPYRCRKYRHEHRNEDITLSIRSVTSDEAPIAFRLSDYSHTEDTRDIRLKQLRQRAANYLLINGIVWQQTGEPRYCINTFGLGHNHGGTGLFVEDFYNPNIPNRNYFSALDGEKTVAYANEVAQRRGDTNDVGRFRTMIEVLIPSCVRVKPMKQHGDGDPFVNAINAITSRSSSAAEAGLLVIAFTATKAAK